MILQKNYVYVWCGNFHTDLRFRPKCIPFLNINFLLYFNFLVHRTLSIKIFSFQKFILQCKYFWHNNTVECSLRIQLPLLTPRVFSQERDLRFGPRISDKSTSTVSQTFGLNWQISAAKHVIQRQVRRDDCIRRLSKLKLAEKDIDIYYVIYYLYIIKFMSHFVLSSPTVACFDLPKQRTCQTVFPSPLLQMSIDLYYICKAKLCNSFLL